MNDDLMLTLLTHGSETIYIPAVFRGKTYQIPACRKSEEEDFRISHNTLMYFYRKIKEEHRDVRVMIRPEFSYISVGYCIAAALIQTKEGDSDVYFGENRVTVSSKLTDKDSPFQIAVNRAEDKAISTEVFGLVSRYFDKNGTPVIFQTGEPIPVSDASNNASQSPVSSGDVAAQGSGLNSVELKEYEKLGNIEVKVNSNGKKEVRIIRDMGDKLLEYFATNSADEQFKKNVSRFLELRRKNGK